MGAESDDWRFGSETRYFKCNIEFIFFQEDDQHFHGYTVELDPQPDGKPATAPASQPGPPI